MLASPLGRTGVCTLDAPNLHSKLKKSNTLFGKNLMSDIHK